MNGILSVSSFCEVCSAVSRSISWARCLPVVTAEKRIYNPANNFFGLSLDKSDHVIQNRTMVVRRYLPSDLIHIRRLILFRQNKSQETSKRSSHGKKKNTFCRSQ